MKSSNYRSSRTCFDIQAESTDCTARRTKLTMERSALDIVYTYVTLLVLVNCRDTTSCKQMFQP